MSPPYERLPTLYLTARPERAQGMRYASRPCQISPQTMAGLTEQICTDDSGSVYWTIKRLDSLGRRSLAGVMNAASDREVDNRVNELVKGLTASSINRLSPRYENVEPENIWKRGYRKLRRRTGGSVVLCFRFSIQFMFHTLFHKLYDSVSFRFEIAEVRFLISESRLR